MAFAELKQKQSVMWGSGPYERISGTLKIAHDHLLGRLRPAAGQRWLDVATGTGEVARPVAHAGAEVTGLDLAPDLIETAKRRAEEEGVEIRFDVGDAESLPYEDASFDVVTSTFGVMFAPDHQAVARELARVCRPGGRLGLATWLPDGGVAGLFAAMRPYQPPPLPGVGSPFEWGKEDYVRELLANAFELEFETGNTPHDAASGEELAELFAEAYGPTKSLLGSLDAERRDEARRDLAEFFGRVPHDGGVRWNREYRLVLGTRR